MYKIFMVVGLLVVGAGWLAYFLWDYKLRKEEAKQPPQRAERLTKTQSEISDWAKQMAQYQKPKAARQARGNQQEKDKE